MKLSYIDFCHKANTPEQENTTRNMTLHANDDLVARLSAASYSSCVDSEMADEQTGVVDCSRENTSGDPALSYVANLVVYELGDEHKHTIVKSSTSEILPASSLCVFSESSCISQFCTTIWKVSGSPNIPYLFYQAPQTLHLTSAAEISTHYNCFAR